MKLEDLIEGEVYYTDTNGHPTIFKCDLNKSSKYTVYGYYWLIDSGFYKSGAWSINNKLRLATPFEKEWLNQCIKANKFISKKEIKFNEINNYSIF